MLAEHCITLRMLIDSLQADGLQPPQIAILGMTPEGCAYWKRLCQARVAVSSAHEANDLIFIGVRHRIRERFGGFDLAALRQVKDWLIEECGLSPEQAETIGLDQLLQKLRGPQRGDVPESQDRLTLDDETHTVTLDKRQYPIEDAKTYGIFKVIYEEYSPGNPVTNKTIQSRVKGIRGKNAVNNYLKKLPSDLSAILLTSTNGRSPSWP